jgi:light-harvesting complex I chlorophyll a/b binding protein 4
MPLHPPTCSYGLLQWDPLGLGANEERLTWFAEAERVHARWAMLAVAGILVQV